MSYGGSETIGVNDVLGDVPGRADADEFGRQVSKIAVAQICESVGFDGFKESAMDSLAEMAIRYICDLGRVANFYANLTGRTQCNVFDIIRGLDDLGVSRGYQSGSRPGNCIAGSSTMREIVEYVSSAEEIPFAQPLPQFPVMKKLNLIPSFDKMGETPSGKHIPPWLPAFPDPHTYIHTPMWNERMTDPRTDKVEQARQRRKAERSLLNLQQRLISSGSVQTSDSTIVESVDRELRTAENSHSVSTSSPTTENNKHSDNMGSSDGVSVLQAFGPAIEAAKGSGLSDDGEDDRKILPDVRPAVQFKFKTVKKFLGESLDLRLQKKGIGRTGFWIGRDEERDDKKRRAEYILRQSMENRQELMQL